GDTVPGSLEYLGERGAHLLFIIDDENARHRGSIVAGPARTGNLLLVSSPVSAVAADARHHVQSVAVRAHSSPHGTLVRYSVN
ncbi:MAG: hypothetical protein ACLFM6_04280, partial [Spirochaetaceae bacterium]